MRPIGSLFAHLAPCPDLLLASVGTSCHERAAFSDRSPPQSERAPAVGKSTRAERPTRGLLGGKDLLCAWLCRESLLPPARGAPYGPGRFIKGDGAMASGFQQHKWRPQLAIKRRQELRAPESGSTPTITANGSAGPHPGDAHPFRRSGQLPAVASDAPATSTPPRRREPGR